MVHNIWKWLHACATILYSNYSSPSTLTTSFSPSQTGRVSSSSDNIEACSSKDSRLKQIHTKALSRGPKWISMLRISSSEPFTRWYSIVTPIPKGPAAVMVPLSFEAQQAPPAQVPRPPSSCAAAALPPQTMHPDQQAAYNDSERKRHINV